MNKKIKKIIALFMVILVFSCAFDNNFMVNAMEKTVEITETENKLIQYSDDWIILRKDDSKEIPDFHIIFQDKTEEQLKKQGFKVQYEIVYRVGVKGGGIDWKDIEDKEELIRVMKKIHSPYYENYKYFITFRIIQTDTDKVISMSDTFDLEEDNGLFQYFSERSCKIVRNVEQSRMEVKINQHIEQKSDIQVLIDGKEATNIMFENYEKNYMYEGKKYSIKYSIISMDADIPLEIHTHGGQDYGFEWKHYEITFEGLYETISNSKVMDREISVQLPVSKATVQEIVKSTCNELGYKIYKCSVCGETFESYYDYNYSHNGKLKEIVEPDCEYEGYTVYECSICGEEYRDNYVDKLEHSFMSEKCTKCGKMKDECIESEHPYKNNTDKTWVFTRKGAKEIYLQFSDDSQIEDMFDYIYIYDKSGNLIQTYTGWWDLRGEYLEIKGDTVKIQFVSDSSGTDFGFSIERIYAIYDKCEHTYQSDVTIPATDKMNGLMTFTCIKCGHTYTQTISKTVLGNSGNIVIDEKEKKKVLPKLQWITSVKIKKVKVGKKKVTLALKKIKVAKGYLIQYSTEKNFKRVKSKYVKNTKYTIKKLKSKKVYYFRAKAYKLVGKKRVMSKQWSKVKKIKVM